MQPFLSLFDYLLKARARLLDWIRPLSAEEYFREFPYGLKTIHATLLHVAGAEWAYGRRLQGQQVSFTDNPFIAEKVLTFAQLEPAWTALSSETRLALSQITDWNAGVEYRMTPPNAPPVRIRTTRQGVASQLILHEVHHRALVMSMLRQLGVAAQNLDYSALMFDREQEVA
ncbi:MAG: DinB family protein [Armatimonadota bacterium]|nr:DinB family protein [Armatimonadota bacterium]